MPPRSPKVLVDETEKACRILEAFTGPSSGRDLNMIIPNKVLANARGIVFVRFYRGSLIFSAKKGSGIIIARLPDGRWSAPSGVSFAAVGVGHDIGMEVIDSIIVLTYARAVKAFYDEGGQMQVGMSASVAVGTLGRGGDVAVSTGSGKNIAATYYYSIAKGMSIGYSLEGSKISERANTNAAFYGRTISAKEILTGAVPPPAMAARLYDKLGLLRAGSEAISPVPSLTQPPSMPPMQPQRPAVSSNASSSAHALASIPSQQPTTAPPKSSEPLHRHDDAPPSYDCAVASSSSSAAAAQSNLPEKTPAVTPVTSDPQARFQPDTKEPIPSGPTLVVALYDFNAQTPNDLSFKAGDIIVVTKSSPDRQSWWRGEIETRTGHFPANYTRDMD